MMEREPTSMAVAVAASSRPSRPCSPWIVRQTRRDGRDGRRPKGGEVDAAERQFQLGHVDSSVSVHVHGLHQALHVPRRKVSDIGLLERRLEFIGVNFSRLVQINGVEESEDGLTGIGQIIRQHEQFFGIFLVVVIVVVVQVVMSMMHFVNDRTARHEEHALGHGVVEQMEQGSTKGDDDDGVVDVVVWVLAAVSQVFVPVQGVGEVKSSTKSGEDVGQLGHRGVRQDLLQIVLDKGDGRRHDGRCSADGGDDERQIGQLAVHRFCTEEREHTGDEVEACVDHGRSVDERRYRRWAFHSVGQPHVERELCRLAHCTDEHQTKRPCKGARIGGRHLVDVGFLEHNSVVEGALPTVCIGVEQCPKNGETHHQEHVTYTGGQKRLLGSVGSAGALVVEPDEEIGTQTHQFPEDEQPEERVGKHHAEHTGAEEHELSVEAVVAVVVDGIRVHVSNSEDVDEQTQEGGDEQQHHRHVVDIDAEAEGDLRHRRLA